MDYPKVPQEINNIVDDNVKLLAQLFPSAGKDGQVDFEALKEELGQFKEVGKEKYELTWSGKQDAKKKAQQDVFLRYTCIRLKEYFRATNYIAYKLYTRL